MLRSPPRMAGLPVPAAFIWPRRAPRSRGADSLLFFDAWFEVRKPKRNGHTTPNEVHSTRSRPTVHKRTEIGEKTTANTPSAPSTPRGMWGNRCVPRNQPAHNNIPRTIHIETTKTDRTQPIAPKIPPECDGFFTLFFPPNPAPRTALDHSFHTKTRRSGKEMRKSRNNTPSKTKLRKGDQRGKDIKTKGRGEKKEREKRKETVMGRDTKVVRLRGNDTAPPLMAASLCWSARRPKRRAPSAR